MNYIVKMSNITKKFGKILANDNVNFHLQKGTINALIGENGAGKSTLMKILYGLHTPDSGTILINGIKQKHHNPAIALKNGIGMVHQHFMLIEKMTIAENLILGKEPSKWGIGLDKKKAIDICQELSDKLGFSIKADVLVEELPIGLRQRLEIMKVLYRGAEILILDEPTAVLTIPEIEEFFNMLRLLKEKGKTIIFISHKLKEIISIADYITIMRSGRIVGEVEAKNTNIDDLASMMLGYELEIEEKKEIRLKDEIILELKNISMLNKDNTQHTQALKNISFKIHSGEILGIAGVQGNGQTELIEVLTGLRHITSGQILLAGEDFTHIQPKQFRKYLSHIPEDRHKLGLVLDFDLSENAILGKHYQKRFSISSILFPLGWLRKNNIIQFTDNLIKQFEIHSTGEKQIASTLSGGNQQKFIVGREMEAKPLLLIAAQPTRGVDIGSIEFIHHQILKLREEGKGILLISSELSELMRLSDRIAILYEGEIVAIGKTSEFDEKQLGLYMTGAIKQEA